jgi:CubicO group peptidase (beta-lactamase class C family)
MNDTAFEVKKRDLNRFAVNYSRDKEGKLIPVDGGRSSDFSAPVSMHSGGGGLVSTMADYLKFSQMLLNGGILNGVRILSPKTVDLMTRNHLQGERSPGWGFGLGVQVCLDVPRTGSLGTEGVYGWSGAAKTFFFIDPEEELIAMVWTQLFGDTDMANKFKVAVYQAMVE